MAKYPYIVNKNGIWYPAGADVPEGADFVVNDKKIGEIKDDVIEITDKEIIKENQFTKSGITRMSTAELKEVAKLNGIDGADEMTGAKLKEVLIEKFEL